MSIKIDQAFTSAILGGGLALDVVNENGSYSTWGGTAYAHHDGVYTPDANAAYLETKMFPADTSAFSLSDSDSHVGTFQVVVRYPVDTGAVAAKTKAESVLALFKIGTVLTYSGQSATITSNTRDGGAVEEGFYQIVVRARYRAFITR